MNIEDVVSGAEGLATARTVYGEVFEKNGTMILPAAKIMGGAGGGAGEDEQHHEGKGTGFGIRAKPTGVFVISDDGVSWKPAVDVNRMILGAQVVAIVALLSLRSIVKARARTRMLLGMRKGNRDADD
ncbi:MAG: spore germination protein GerW family protein [Actinomycetota bacterium]